MRAFVPVRQSRIRVGATRALAAMLLLGGAACHDPVSPGEPNLGIPRAGEFRGSVVADSFATTDFVAGRSGETTVAVCGPAGSNFDIEIVGVAGAASATTSNCEEVTFDADLGARYTVRVTATSGGGPYLGCYSNAIARCAARVPVAGDPRIPADYYLSAEGRTGAALIAALHEIVKQGHRVLGYNDARDSMYANIEDPDNDNVVIDVYVGRAAANVFNRATALAADINTEHSWPQSRGAETDPANSDVHHLFPSDETANGQRSNYPLGVVTGAVSWESPPQAGSSERSRLGFSASGQLVFEPRASKKGDLARALLYFYVRYKLAPTSNFSLPNFNIEEATLIMWAKADPPSPYEIERHQLAYRAQGNRNPFVDRPDFLDAIGDFPNQ